MTSLRIWLLPILASYSIASFGQAGNGDEPATARLDSIINSVITYKGRKAARNFLLYGENGATDFKYQGSAGIIGRSDDPVPVDAQFKSASITKTFVSVVALQLVEEGLVSLDEPAIQYLRNVEGLRFDEIHIMNDTAYSDQITVRMLMNHTSGIADIFNDSKFILNILLHKKRQYDEHRVMDKFYKYDLNEKAFFKPGEGYHYSDNNYMAVGFLIEEVTGKSLAQNIRERILEPLELSDTYFEYYEEPMGNGIMADQYYNRTNVTKKVNTSYEWAGGGLVSTTRDLAAFIQAVFEMRLFNSPETLAQMTDLSVDDRFGMGGGLGIFDYELNGMKFYGHGGFYGSLMMYCPDKKITVVANVGQANVPFDEVQLLSDIVGVLSRTGLENP